MLLPLIVQNLGMGAEYDPRFHVTAVPATDTTYLLPVPATDTTYLQPVPASDTLLPTIDNRQ